MKTLGIIGGLGPDTTAEFYRMVIRRARCRFTDSYPRVLVHSIPVPFSVERNIVRYGRGEEEMVPLLSEGLGRLEQAGADYLAIPCNTVHMFHRRLQGELRVPLLDILAETAEVCRNRGFLRVGVLATGKTIDAELYQRALEHAGMEAVIPGADGRETLSELVFRILAGRAGEGEREVMRKLAASLADAGAEAAILGCTDLQHLVSPDARAYGDRVSRPEGEPAGHTAVETPEETADRAVLLDPVVSSIPLVDSLESLAKAVVRDME